MKCVPVVMMPSKECRVTRFTGRNSAVLAPRCPAGFGLGFRKNLNGKIVPGSLPIVFPDFNFSLGASSHLLDHRLNALDLYD
jgi:hypothetical protein